MTSLNKQGLLEEDNGNIRCKMNDDASLYHNSNYMQTKDAIICLEEYTPKMKWDDGECTILDIGCGDGSVTNIIKKYVPRNYRELIGCDINEKMINFANEKYKNEKLYFRILDIEGSLPDELKEGFNHVFSFYALHWIQNQEKAFANIYNMLSKDGDCLLAFLGYMPLYTAYCDVARTTKWKKWIPSCEGFTLPYYHIQEPDIHITNMLKEIGFKNAEVKCKQMNFTHTIEGLKNTARSINPFPMPKEVYDQFLDDFITLVRDRKLIDIVNDNIAVSDQMTATIKYNLIVVYGTKS